MTNIYFDDQVIKTGNDLNYEHVERKGIGHPDTLCDQIAERSP